MPGAPTPIRNVADTARWVAFYRAMETERPDALFHDPFARRLAGERGQAILDAMPKGRRMAWPIIVRTAVMDEIVMRLVTQQEVNGVLNLAAGLDARPWRLQLPETLRWWDVDLAVMLDHKEAVLQGERPRCLYAAIRLDLSEPAARREVIRAVGSQAKRLLVITEGLLIYLDASAVADLAKDLAAQPACRYWLTDLASPGLLRMLEKSWAPVLRAGNAPLKFGPAESTGFFAPFGWREIEYRALFEESIRLGRSMPLARLWKFLGRFYPKRRREEFKRFSGVALLARS